MLYLLAFIVGGFVGFGIAAFFAASIMEGMND